MMKIAPSILSADFSKLGEDIREVEAGGADYIHVDVMDGHFVPNITLGPPIVKAIRPITGLPLDVHLMISEPAKYVDAFVDAGADYITVHVEADPHIHRTIQMIKNRGVKAGVVLNPGTPAELIKPVLADLDMVLLMTVNPGFGGQAFIPSVVTKIKEIRELADELNPSLEIEVDGGINPETIAVCAEAGADVFVAGSAIYNQSDRKKAIEDLKAAASAGKAE
ncbi:ribulose-phosphate 3-epimerase [Rossellomorea marisflavi]|uniref:Ribulose-phosphate 3-epimerase n=1 Tax=Rossellomorea marisflavi TaxID=189381 RepID=A0A165KS58_9BACI|nr:ribulose-phosphate 3-epimerase [Rossellomorea marisflavi]KMK96989.1 ribulose-phosphate 3-epimerase [Rossellomorea marisflavi]KZE49989.1 ribulose phosphate epimerase [Rossellomorea marisflavi]MCM2603529.1 ribulose-phosphate 3-epimerase [Rossellomorea marisflavi]QHA38431.1 ribulose-phosphate 3-epimerase [Rossellomorea marisflavi]USK94397.1 ribulose-phosphate 3-epimerase [Rossellomorea marisflavi]